MHSLKRLTSNLPYARMTFEKLSSAYSYANICDFAGESFIADRLAMTKNEGGSTAGADSVTSH